MNYYMKLGLGRPPRRRLVPEQSELPSDGGPREGRLLLGVDQQRKVIGVWDWVATAGQQLPVAPR
jgi:hypothetical protein